MVVGLSGSCWSGFAARHADLQDLVSANRSKVGAEVNRKKCLPRLPSSLVFVVIKVDACDCCHLRCKTCAFCSILLLLSLLPKFVVNVEYQGSFMPFEVFVLFLSDACSQGSGAGGSSHTNAKKGKLAPGGLGNVCCEPTVLAEDLVQAAVGLETKTVACLPQAWPGLAD